MTTFSVLRPLGSAMIAMAVALAMGQTSSGGTPLDRFGVEIRTVDDYDVASGQSFSVDPHGFDVEVVVSRRGEAVSHVGGDTLGTADLATIGSSVIRFEAILPDGQEAPLNAIGDLSDNGTCYTHLRLDPELLSRFDAISNPDLSIVATLTPSAATAAQLSSFSYPSSRPVRLGLKISALRGGAPVVPYLYRKVQNLPLKPVFSRPLTVRADEAYIAGQAPNVPGNLPYYLWLRYTEDGSAVSHFAPIAPPGPTGWRTDLSFVKPGDYRMVAFASPHADTSTFAADGWRSDAYAISPEVTQTIVPAGFHITVQALSILLALVFLAVAMLMLRNPNPAPQPGPDAEGVGEFRRAPTFTARAHKALAWALLAIATITIVNYYEFFTTIVATGLRGDPIIGQDWNTQNSGGISLLIMSYSISLGLCMELGIYKLITLWRERQGYGPAAVLLSLVWLAAVCLAGWCAFAFIIHIGEFYNTQPALRELGHLAGAAELVIFFSAIGGLMPMEHESWPEKVPQAQNRKPGWLGRVFRRKQPAATPPKAVAYADVPAEGSTTVL